MIPLTLLHAAIALEQKAVPLPTTPISRSLRMLKDLYGSDMQPHQADYLTEAADLIEELTMLKPRPKLKGQPLGNQYKLDKEGKIYHAGNPKASVSQKIAKKKNPTRKWRAAK